jgi:hypothetical protein
MEHLTNALALVPYQPSEFQCVTINGLLECPRCFNNQMVLELPWHCVGNKQQAPNESAGRGKKEAVREAVIEDLQWHRFKGRNMHGGDGFSARDLTGRLLPTSPGLWPLLLTATWD